MEDIFYMNINPDDETGTNIISLVELPAMQSNFIAFSEYENVQLSVNNDEQIITGVLAIPNKIIPRKNNQSYVLTRDQIKSDSIKFFKRNAIKNVNLEHSLSVNHIYVIESWLTGEVDKAHALFGQLPVGTWCVSMKIDNPKVWSLIKEGKLKGFSLEGMFELQKAELSQEEKSLDQIKDLLNIFLFPEK